MSLEKSFPQKTIFFMNCIPEHLRRIHLTRIGNKLDHLVELGINAIEIMPVAQFPGNRNWGYDGVFPFAVQHSYGGARELQQLVNTCHEKALQ